MPFVRGQRQESHKAVLYSLSNLWKVATVRHFAFLGYILYLESIVAVVKDHRQVYAWKQTSDKSTERERDWLKPAFVHHAEIQFSSRVPQ